MGGFGQVRQNLVAPKARTVGGRRPQFDGAIIDGNGCPGLGRSGQGRLFVVGQGRGNQGGGRIGQRCAGRGEGQAYDPAYGIKIIGQLSCRQGRRDTGIGQFDICQLAFFGQNLQIIDGCPDIGCRIGHNHEYSARNQQIARHLGLCNDIGCRIVNGDRRHQ